MSRYKVLIDSSVWIEYFKSGGIEKLDRLIEEDLACTNELILTELAPALVLKNEMEIFQGLQAISMIHLNVDWEIVRDYQIMNLKNGINKVGIPDLIILQQIIDEKITLFSFDKHFKLMQSQLNFDLISE
ncbi:MAG: PIN domain-containing protein [Bacteroidota bacterium]